ncbi:hypothetical protein ILUMI_09235 [Ignelater luminosus]|uniref:PCI domain-containing protein n=1 Tax=Ignelater luminosus TaxID=2038154 RepID=A0A8K0GF90_IGNLU|nr:hypothetical protein ILUMI_09235 [Ignelater luminosus]
MDSDIDTEDYNLVYSEDSGSETDIDLENHYFYAKNVKAEGIEDSLKCFQTVLILEDGVKTIWGYKALKQIIKINFALAKFLQELYEVTLQALKQNNNKRLWFKTNLKLGWLYFGKRDFKNVSMVIKELRKDSTLNGKSDENKAKSLLLEVNALEMQLFIEQKQLKKFKALYEESLNIEVVLTNSDIIAIIKGKECGGKMYLQEQQYEKACQDFYAAFKNYYISANSRKIICLKYVLLTNMLTNSEINPFDSPEARPYEDLPELVALKNLFLAYNANDIRLFDKILQQNRENIMNDSFIKEHIEELWDNIKVRMAVRLAKSYTKIRIPYVATELNVTSEEAEHILVKCILNGMILGKIDQVNQILIIFQQQDNSVKYQALTRWCNSVDRSLKNVISKFN